VDGSGRLRITTNDPIHLQFKDARKVFLFCISSFASQQLWTSSVTSVNLSVQPLRFSAEFREQARRFGGTRPHSFANPLISTFSKRNGERNRQLGAPSSTRLSSLVDRFRVPSLGNQNNLNAPAKNLIVEVIAGPTGADLMSYVVARGNTRLFGGSHRKSKEEMTPISDSGMSVPHFRISNLGDKILLRDCESRNGTIVDGQKVTEKYIDEGTTFKAGRTEFQVRWEKPPELPVPKAVPIEVEPTLDSSVLPELPKPDGGALEHLPSAYDLSGNSSMLELPQLPIPDDVKELQNFEGPIDPGESESYPQLPNPITSMDGEPPGNLVQSHNTYVHASDSYRSDASHVAPIVRLILPSTALWSDFDRVIRDLGLRYDLYVIAHFAKLPDHRGDSRVGIPLFPHLDPAGSAFPVGIEKHDWFLHFHNQLGERLVAVDGLLVTLCQSKTAEAADGLRSLGSAAIPGVSHHGGFVPWCWPSGLYGILDSLSDAGIAKWMGGAINGLIFPHRDRIFAYTRLDHMETLLEIGFQ